MSWEAQRWTAKTPSELYHTLGPHGVDDLIRQAIAAIWRDLPGEDRSFADAQARAREALDRNLSVWKKIKQVTPEAFFADMQPHAADQFIRQAMVMTWMMMPRVGGREVKDALKIVSEIFERNMEAWAEDNRTFTKGAKFSATAKPRAKKSKPAKAVKAAKPAKTKSRAKK